MTVDVHRYDSTDLDESRPLIDSLYSPDTPIRWNSVADDFHFRMRSTSVGELGAERVRLTADTSCTTHSPDLFVGFVGVAGAIRWRSGSQDVNQTRGVVACYPSDPVDSTLVDVTVESVRLPLGTLARVHREHSGELTTAFRMLGVTAVSERAAAQWRALSAHVHHECDADASSLEHPLVAAALVDLVAAVALSVFPHSAMGPDYRPGPGYAGPATVRRAVAYLEENSTEPLTVSDIAEAAGVTPRALQHAFRKTFDLTPMAYLRRHRLEAVHRELTDADPTAGATVTDIAARHGFSPSARFTSFYRQRFGVVPAHTLRHGG